MTLYRYQVYEPNGAIRGPLTHASVMSFSSPMNEVSAMELTHMPNLPGADFFNQACEVGVECSSDGVVWTEIPNGRYILMGRDFEEIGGSSARKYTLPGYALQLSKARQMQVTNLNADGKRPFLSTTAGTIISTLLQEAQTRGVIPGFTWDFNTTTDSAGRPWDKIITIYYEPGLDIYTILDNLATQGMCDWRMVGRKLQMFNSDTFMGSDSATVLKPGTDVKSLPIQTSSQDLINMVYVQGDEGKSLKLSNPTVAMPWGNWEGYISHGGVSDPGTMTLLATTMLDSNGFEKVQYTAELNTDSTSYDEFIDYFPGQYVRGPAENGQSMRYRVRQINVTAEVSKVPKVNLVLNDFFQEREILNSKRTKGIVGGATAGGSGSRPSEEKDDKRIPKKVTGLVVSSAAYLNAFGQVNGQVTMVWDPVTQATNNTAIDEVTYSVSLRRAIIGEKWREAAWTDEPGLTFSPLDVGVEYQFKVTAIMQPGDRRGETSDVYQTLIANDATAPPKPSPPLLTTKLGTITVKWDGKTATGGDMPIDFSHIAVWWTGTNTSGTFTQVIGSIQKGYGSDFLVVTNLAVVPQDFSFVAYDNSGNASVISEHAVITPVRIEGPDIQANTVTANEIAAGAITTVALGAEAVTSAKIKAGAITADKIEANAITASKIAADAITGKTITGGTISGAMLIGTRIQAVDGLMFGAEGEGYSTMGYSDSLLSIYASGRFYVSSHFRCGTLTVGYGAFSAGANGIAALGAISGQSLGTNAGVTNLTSTNSYLQMSTTTTAANVTWSSGGLVRYVSSLRKFKRDREQIEADYGILDLNAMTWVDSQVAESDTEFKPRIPGFVAEDVAIVSAFHGHAFDPLLTKDEEGELTGVAYDRVSSYLIPVMRDMVARIEQLEQESKEMNETMVTLSKRLDSLGG